MQSRSIALLIMLLILLLACIGFSCNPAKKVLQANGYTDQLKDQYQTERERIAAQAVNDFVAHNPCPQIPEFNLDSLCDLYCGRPEVTDNTQQDYAGGNTPDTVRLPGKRIAVPYEDTRRLNLYKDSLQAKDIRLAAMAATIAASKATAAEMIKAGLKTKNWFMWLFVIIAIVEAAALIIVAKK